MIIRKVSSCDFGVRELSRELLYLWEGGGRSSLLLSAEDLTGTSGLRGFKHSLN